MKANAVIMVVDDEEGIRHLVRAALNKEGYDVVEAEDAESALLQLDTTLPDLMLVDMKMPKMNGLRLIEEAKARDKCLSVIMFTGHGSVGTAVEAMRLGACDFIEKPFSVDRLRDAVAKVLADQSLRREVMMLHDEQRSRFGELGSVLIGKSRQMTHVYRLVKQVAQSSTTTVLIQGESGTGKELIAKAVHMNSDRRNRRFMDINCAALTESLLEAEIFGYEKGAFTGAVTTGKTGLFEAASGGTVFLDEIGEMGLALQSKLLRVLQERKFKRVGGVDDVEVDVRIIASTNRDLAKMVEDGEFRLDLFYRLQVVPIQVPPLRDRKEDILPIAQHYIAQFGSQIGRNFAGLDADVQATLEAHTWPGNVRELKNVMERAVILSRGAKIGMAGLLFGGTPERSGPKVEFEMRDLSIAAMERQLIRKVLDNTSWKRTEAARILGINRTTLYNKIRDYDLAQVNG